MMETVKKTGAEATLVLWGESVVKVGAFSNFLVRKGKVGLSAYYHDISKETTMRLLVDVFGTRILK